MISRIIKKTVDLSKIQKVDQLEGPLYQLENGGHTFEITCLMDGAAASVSGTVSARFLRADEETVYFTGTLSGNVASVTLPQSCYNKNGRFGLVVFIAGNDITSAVYAVAGNVYRSTSDHIIDPTEEIPSLEDLIAKIGECEEATEAAEAAAAFVPNVIAPAYSASGTYAVGDYVTKDGYLYRCNTAISTAEAWTAAHWTQVTTGAELGDLKSATVGEKYSMTFTDGGYVKASDGTIGTDSVSAYSNWVEIAGGTVALNAVLSTSETQFNAFYDSNKTFISARFDLQDGTIYVPSNAKYFRISKFKTTQNIDIYPVFGVVRLKDYTDGEIGCLKSAIDNIEQLKKITQINSGYKSPGTLTDNGKISNTSNAKYYVILGSEIESDDEGYFNCTGLDGCKLIVTMDPTYTTSVKVFVCKAKPYYASDVLASETFTESGQITLPTNSKYISIGVVSVSGTSSGLPNSQNTTSIAVEDVLFREYLDTTLTEAAYPPSAKAVSEAISAATSDIPTLNTRVTNANIAQLRINPNNFVNHGVNFVARTGRTNLFLGYGTGTNTIETDDGSGGDPQDGNFNVGVGYEALNQNTTGNHCTAVGFTAMKKNISGKFNTGIGEDAMFSNTTGHYNVAVGTHALQTNNGSYNVVIGADSVRHTNDATRNMCIVIGGFINLDADASNVIVIAEGHRSGSPDYTTISGSNMIVIGNSTHQSVMIAGKVINFNQDGTVTWSEPT